MVDPVQIELAKIGKRFKHWIFKDVNLVLEPSTQYGVIGRNGIGKSTLLRIISGYTSPSTGVVTYTQIGEKLDILSSASTVSFAAPYIDLIDELTVVEMLQFHRSFRKTFPELEQDENLLEAIELSAHKDVLVGDLSSGLMQRLKVGLMIVSKSSVLLLDEPTSYLDLSGKKWFHQLLGKYQNQRLVVIASNDPEDLVNADHNIDMQQFVRSGKN